MPHRVDHAAASPFSPFSTFSKLPSITVSLLRSPNTWCSLNSRKPDRPVPHVWLARSSVSAGHRPARIRDQRARTRLQGAQGLERAERCVGVAEANGIDRVAHQLARQVRQAQQVVLWGHLQLRGHETERHPDQASTVSPG